MGWASPGPSVTSAWGGTSGPRCQPQLWGEVAREERGVASEGRHLVRARCPRLPSSCPQFPFREALGSGFIRLVCVFVTNCK